VLIVRNSVIVMACLASIEVCFRGDEREISPQPDSTTEATNGEAVMSQEHKWNDTWRDDLRATLSSFIHGELRLMRRDREEILNACREIYLEDECPESEREAFVQFAAADVDQTEARFASEKSTWPAETDCDRLDRIEATLRDRGILLWQVSPCCDTCTRGELPDRIRVINDRHPGFRNRIRGYAFFIDQNMPEMLSDSTELSVYLGYGWFSPDNSEASKEVYETNALNIAREVAECLKEEGFGVDWDGNLARKIGLSINWQRRELLD